MPNNNKMYPGNAWYICETDLIKSHFSLHHKVNQSGFSTKANRYIISIRDESIPTKNGFLNNFYAEWWWVRPVFVMSPPSQNRMIAAAGRQSGCVSQDNLTLLANSISPEHRFGCFGWHDSARCAKGKTLPQTGGQAFVGDKPHIPTQHWLLLCTW